MLAHWNEWADPDGANDPVEAPDTDYILHRQQILAERGIGKVLH